jgi:molybdopterin-guanine dinucleotide biosynthesis protein A
MGGEDKGLPVLNGRPMIDYIIGALRLPSGHIIINANRNPDRYLASGYPVVADMPGDHFGALAGMATGMQAATTPLLLVVSCASPFIPAQLCSMLRIELEMTHVKSAWRMTACARSLFSRCCAASCSLTCCPVLTQGGAGLIPGLHSSGS